MLKYLVIAAMMIGSTPSPAEEAKTPTPKPPVAKKVPKETRINGDVLKDDYFWLREKSKPEVREYIEAENAYTDAVMAPTKPLQAKLYKELLSHVKETDESVPNPEGGWMYYSRVVEGKQYPILARKHGAGAAEQITVDVNELASGEKFMALGAYQISDDGNFAAYSTDNTGFRQYRLNIKDLRTGAVLPEHVEKTNSIAWANDNKTIFYVVEDSAKRPYRLYKHLLGTDTAKDELIYEEKDESYNVDVYKARDKQFLFMVLGSHTTSETRFLDANTPTGAWKTIAPRIHEQEYYVDSRGDRFYIRTNKDGRNFSIATAPVADPGRENWKTIVPYRPAVMIDDFDVFSNFLVLTERENGLPEISVTDLRTSKSDRVRFPEAVYVAAVGPNKEFNATSLRYIYQSPITPPSTFDYDMEKKQSTLLKENQVPGGFDRNNYVVERLWAPSYDGVKVPVTVFYRKGVKKDGTAPLYQYAYGSYGIPLNVTFSSNRLALLDRGVVIALAHIRGGGDLGKPWHDAGRMLNKMNTFKDFIAAADFLVQNKYAAKDRIAIEGGSAGGLLMGAVTNMRPICGRQCSPKSHSWT